jgi:hypothetical protein
MSDARPHPLASRRARFQRTVQRHVAGRFGAGASVVTVGLMVRMLAVVPGSTVRE